jgi:hypothetical protein
MMNLFQELGQNIQKVVQLIKLQIKTIKFKIKIKEK